MAKKYQNGKIYQITDIAYTKCYIGATTVSLSKRMSNHREMYKRYREGKCPKQMRSTDLFEEFGVQNSKIELIELYPCSCKEELIKREGHFIRTTPCVNRNIPDRNQKQFRLETKEQKAEYDKIYRQEHKEKITQNKKDKYERSAGYVCPCGSTYNYTNRSHHVKTKTHLAWEALNKEPDTET